jgi:iron(III) transport system substrate-binding protein
MYRKIGGLVVSLTTVFSCSVLAELPQGYPADYQKVVMPG